VLEAKRFLARLANPRREDGIKKIPKEVRLEASAVLRHFPEWFDIGRADCWDEQEAIRFAEEEAGGD
jgi:hypothetical protein